VNVIGDQDVQGTPIVEMDVEDYLRPIQVAVRAKFVTSRAAARHMIRQGSGVLLTFGGPFDYGQTRGFNVGGIGATFDAVESLRRQLAVELGRYNIRVITLRTGGLPESIPGDTPEMEALRDHLTGLTLTGRAAALEDVGNIAVFAASDLARPITGAAINISAGATID
jgi:NAD(P)-dependent dehydrogenase (short-subunit alcohol dehydrogenase family)